MALKTCKCNYLTALHCTELNFSGCQCSHE